jgi:hypothetical protein
MSREEYHGITQQRLAAFKRLRDAEALLAEEKSARWLRAKGEHARGAMYLAGYAIEWKLKAVAMETFRCHTLAQLAVRLDVGESQVYSHGLEAIAKRLPFWSVWRRSPIFKDLSTVSRWRPSWGYDPLDWPNAQALAFLSAVRRVYDRLDRNQ